MHQQIPLHTFRASVRFPIRIFLRLRINDDNLIIGKDYTHLHTRVSCYAKIAHPGQEPCYGVIKHFCSFSTTTHQEIHLAAVQFYTTSHINYNLPIIHALPNAIQYIPIQYIQTKINLFPIFSENNNKEITGYWVTPSCRQSK
eukprot:Phypoly_transcript_20204.p1 GENE.Phypoly_transcript_20204~~Phypoly_transcript_20204.p1  ORF type:complete len:143 (+),score=2.71 Phypoly_transcript_20204:249-677(+)